MIFRYIIFFSYALTFILSSSVQGGECSNNLVYKSDSDNSYQYLEGLQEKIYIRFPNLADPFLRENIEKSDSLDKIRSVNEKLINQKIIDLNFSEEIIEKIRCETLTTRYESPITFVAINNIIEYLEGTRVKLYPEAKTVKFGTLPTNRINAKALFPRSSNNPIIIIDRDVFSFTGAISKSVVDAIPIQEVDGQIVLKSDIKSIRDRIEENPEILENFYDAIIKTLKSGHPRKARQRVLDAQHNSLHARVVTGMDMFYIAHEYAHTFLNHITKNSPQESEAFFSGSGFTEKKSPESISVRLISQTKANELEADKAALQLILNNELDSTFFNPVVLSARIGAIDLLFKSYEMINIYRSQAGLPSYNSSTHPTATERREAIDNVYYLMAQNNPRLKEVPDIRDLLTVVLVVLSDKADPFIRKELNLLDNSSYPEEIQLPYSITN